VTSEDRKRLAQAAQRLPLTDAEQRAVVAYVEREISNLRRGRTTSGAPQKNGDAKAALQAIRDAAHGLMVALDEHLEAARPHLAVNMNVADVAGQLLQLRLDADLAISDMCRPGPKRDSVRDRFEHAIVMLLGWLGVALPEYAGAPWALFLAEASEIATGDPMSRAAAVKRLRQTADLAATLSRERIAR
jgi:hypothetical protein